MPHGYHPQPVLLNPKSVCLSQESRVFLFLNQSCQGARVCDATKLVFFFVFRVHLFRFHSRGLTSLHFASHLGRLQQRRFDFFFFLHSSHDTHIHDTWISTRTNEFSSSSRDMSTTNLPPLPAFALGSEEAKRLQGAIQRDLAHRGWSDADDDVMAEYILVMLANKKTAAQIGNELQELVGAESTEEDGGQVVQAFIQGMWEEAGRILSASSVSGNANGDGRIAEETEVSRRRSPSPVTDASAGPSSRGMERRRRSASPEASRAHVAAAVDDDRWRAKRGSPIASTADWGRGERGQVGRGPYRPSGRGRELFDERRQEDSQARWNGSGQDRAPERRELFNQGAAPDRPRAMRIQGVSQGGEGSLFQRSINQVHNQQQQQQPTRQSGSHSPSIFARAGVPDPHAAAFVPSYQQNLAPNYSQPSLLSRIDPMIPDNEPMPSQSGMADATITSFPDKPTNASLCRWGTRCTDPSCVYSHPSTAAASRKQADGPSNNSEGAPLDDPLVLRKEPCRFGSGCTKVDCDFSHVSPAVAFTKAKLERQGGTAAAAAAAALASFTASNTETDRSACRFQQECTNPSCAYVHFDPATGAVGPSPALFKLTRSTPGKTATNGNSGGAAEQPDSSSNDAIDIVTEEGGAIVAEGESSSNGQHPGLQRALGDKANCRFGVQCTRKDCSFAHPFGRTLDGNAVKSSFSSSSQVPCRYGKACTRGELLLLLLFSLLLKVQLLILSNIFILSSADCFFSHPEGKASAHISDRLSKFGGEGDDAEMETIIPGQAAPTPAV